MNRQGAFFDCPTCSMNAYHLVQYTKSDGQKDVRWQCDHCDEREPFWVQVDWRSVTPFDLNTPAQPYNDDEDSLDGYIDRTIGGWWLDTGDIDNMRDDENQA